jgi:hypothetical protein
MKQNQSVPSEDGYSVGFAANNRVILNIRSGDTTTSLSLNDQGVRRLIKLLSAMLPCEDGK